LLHLVGLDFIALPTLKMHGQTQIKYELGAKYCRSTLDKIGVSVFVHTNLKITNINTEDNCKYHAVESCALNLESHF
jgi:hypothetical protein